MIYECYRPDGSACEPQDRLCVAKAVCGDDAVVVYYVAIMDGFPFDPKGSRLLPTRARLKLVTRGVFDAYAKYLKGVGPQYYAEARKVFSTT